MTIVLASKPGITGANTLDIPKDWDAKWFRNLINNKLKGGDVRNAVGANGISVTGNIASPYATISIGGQGASYPIILTPPAATYALQIDGATFAGISFNASGATGFTSDLYLFQNAGAAGSGGSYLGTRNANTLHIQTNSVDRLTINGSGAVTIAAPSSGIALALTGVVGGDPILQINAASASATDRGIQHVFPGNYNIFNTYNDGHFILGWNGVAQTLLGSASGAVTISAATSTVNSLTVNGAANAYATSIAGSVTTGQSFGVVLSAGTNASDQAILVRNQSGSVTGLIIDGTMGVKVGAKFAMNSQAPVTTSTGYGTPTGNAKQASFAASTITLPLLAAAVAQLILDLKSLGFLGT